MCQLIAVNKGLSKSSDFLLESIRRASTTNTDGIGYAFKRSRSNKIYISKGFSNVDEFIDILLKKNLKEEDELIVHLRIGNKGAKTTAMNHPFVLSDDDDTVLSNNKFVGLPVMAHNGTFYDYSEYNTPESDTYRFARDFMSVPEIQDLLKRDEFLFANTFKHILKTNRLAFLFPDNTPLITLGEFKHDQGYLFSNDSYIKKVYNIGGIEHEINCNCSPCRTRRMNEWNRYDIDEEDVKPKVNSKYSSNSFAITRHRESDAEVEMQRIIASHKGTKIGDRKRDNDGLLLFNPEFDINPPSTSIGSMYTSIYNMSNKITLYPVPGGMLYTPIRYMTSQFNSTTFVPKIFNYKHFTYFNPLGNEDREINPRDTYKIYEFDTDEKGINIGSKFGVHLVGPSDYNPVTLKRITDVSWFSTTEIIRYFTSNYDVSLRQAYLTLYRLLQKYTVPSKNLCIQSQKAINGALKKDESKHSNITFKAINGCTLLGLKLFYNYEVAAIYEPAVAKGMYYSVQEEDDDKTITHQQALADINAMSN